MSTTLNHDMRDSFFDRFYEVAARDPQVVMLAADFDAFGLKKFKQEFPARFINVGVSEQNMINLACGMALKGKKVFCYSIASFMAARCFEQIKLNICALKLPITLVGGGVGLSFGFDGVSHHAVQDVALMRTLPEMRIFNCSDYATASAAVDYAMKSKDSPVYVRLDKGQFPTWQLSESDLLGGFRVLRKVQPVTIVTTGYMTQVADKVAESLRESGLHVGLVDTFVIDSSSMAEFAKAISAARTVIVIEENVRSGGLSTKLAEITVDAGLSSQIIACTLPDEHLFQYGDRNWFHAKYGLDQQALQNKVKDYASVA